jgi:hypothetical protein
MPGLTNEELAQLLDQVDSKDFVQFFSDRNIPPPGDGSKKDMIARLLAE